MNGPTVAEFVKADGNLARLRADMRPGWWRSSRSRRDRLSRSNGPPGGSAGPFFGIREALPRRRRRRQIFQPPL
jgi:hypothetical protein